MLDLTSSIFLYKLFNYCLSPMGYKMFYADYFLEEFWHNRLTNLLNLKKKKNHLEKKKLFITA